MTATSSPWLVMTAVMAVLARRFAAVSLGAIMTARALFDAVTQTGPWHGLWQRIAITTGFTWFGVAAIQRLRAARARSERPQAVP